MSGIARAGRPVEIDLHAKGVDQRIIDIALATGLPVRVSPKFWAEHMGLPYLQASIRALELPREDRQDPLMSLSTGSRNHMRYSYGDLLREDRRYGGPPPRLARHAAPAALGRSAPTRPGWAARFSAHGADGVEYMEPCRSRAARARACAGGRDAYRGRCRCAPARADWRKYEYTYRLWGRLAYAPEAQPRVLAPPPAAASTATRPRPWSRASRARAGSCRS